MVLYNFKYDDNEKLRIIESQKYLKWYKRLDKTQKIEVDTRTSRIKLDRHFGDFKRIGDVFEMRFRNGLRIYFARDRGEIILLLNGGGKNSKSDQSRDINQAKKIYEDYKNGKSI